VKAESSPPGDRLRQRGQVGSGQVDAFRSISTQSRRIAFDRDAFRSISTQSRNAFRNAIATHFVRSQRNRNAFRSISTQSRRISFDLNAISTHFVRSQLDSIPLYLAGMPRLPSLAAESLPLATGALAGLPGVHHHRLPRLGQGQPQPEPLLASQHERGHQPRASGSHLSCTGSHNLHQ